ncbi:MAG: amidohydrolase family protein [Rhodobacteraceae bacterium]|nr:amidohydrolase family protein [Paracoccaceae bacterium]
MRGRDPATGRGIEVSLDGGVVAGITACSDAPPYWIFAGLIDLQVNGYGGIDLNDGSLTPERVADLSRLLRGQGVTTWLPTLITASEASLTAALSAIAAAREADPLVAHSIPGVHVEGPFIAPEDGPRGAHPAEHVRPPDAAEVTRWQAACGGLVRMVTLSPHWPETEVFVRALSAQGIHVALGHTNATPDQIRAAVDAGARFSTHLGNGASAMLPRHPNMIWSQLADDRLTASFIADGHHLPADAFKAMLRAKGLDRAMLVSDAAALGGMAPGLYDAPIGGRVELRADGWLGTPGTPYLAGAARPLNEDVAIAAVMADLPLADALALATVNPGRLVGGRGRLRPGEPADLFTFGWKPGDRSLAVSETWLRGERG